MRWIAVRQSNRASRCRGSDERRTCHNPVGNNFIIARVKSRYALDRNRIRAGSHNACAHLVKEILQILNFGLTGRIRNHGSTFRQSRCHHNILRSPDAWKVKMNVGADQLAGPAPNLLMPLLNDGSQSLQSPQVQINFPFTDRTPAGLINANLFESRKQRSHKKNRRSHLTHQIFRHMAGVSTAGVDHHGIALMIRFAAQTA
ncbi:hypothetical protein D3C77_540070 [compost metagenome]